MIFIGFSSSGDRTAIPARSVFAIRLATRNDTPATGPSARAFPGSLPIRLVLTAPAPIRPYSGWNSNTCYILRPEFLDSVPNLRRLLELEFTRRVAHALFQLPDEMLTLLWREILFRLLGLRRHRYVVAFRDLHQHHVDRLD